jgi:adenylate cyclase
MKCRAEPEGALRPPPSLTPTHRAPTIRLMSRHRLESYLLCITGWIAAAAVFTLIRYFGLESVPQFEGADFAALEPGALMLRAAFLGIIMGSVYFLLDWALDRPAIRRRPYGVLILLQTAGNVVLVTVTIMIVAMIEVSQGETEGLVTSIVNRVFSTNGLIVLLYVTIVSFLFSFLKTVDRKFGPGNLWKLIIGAYYHPKEEELIFMFLDLKASTTHAERLGHVRFSKLIQDCFIDLSVVINHQALVYQYVGDEVILYWNVAEGLKNGNCMRAYFRFIDRLNDRGAYYRDTYGVEPEFKAGLNLGSATVLEIGEIKREISYLGDVLNTAARIQGKCNDYGEQLLISGTLKDRFPTIPDDLELKEIGAVELRGREEAVAILSVRRK